MWTYGAQADPPDPRCRWGGFVLPSVLSFSHESGVAEHETRKKRPGRMGGTDVEKMKKGWGQGSVKGEKKNKAKSVKGGKEGECSKPLEGDPKKERREGAAKRTV